MKKILIFLFLVYNYSFSSSCTVIEQYSRTSTSASECRTAPSGNWLTNVKYADTGYTTCNLNWIVSDLRSGNKCLGRPEVPVIPQLENPDNGLCHIDPNTYELVCNYNPDPQGGQRCKDLFVKDGNAYTCNPNTNEASLIDNSNGLEDDEDGGKRPKCNEGFEYAVVPNMNPSEGTSTMYNSWSCLASSPSNPDNGTTPENNIGITTETNTDGSTTSTLPDGTKVHTSTNGTITTTYPNGNTTVSGGSGTVSGGSGSSGSSGGGSASGGSGALTPSESGTQSDDTPYIPESVANSCSSSSLTLQEKMLCELNQGMKNQNSEGNPSNSLNNLIKNLNSDTSDSLTAVNKNIKFTNDNLEIINKNTANTNQNLQSLTNQTYQNNTELKAINETLKNIATNTKDTSTNTGSTTTVTTPGESIFDSDEINPDMSDLNDSSSWTSSILGTYTTFFDNVQNSNDTFKTLALDVSNQINEGFNLNFTNENITNCPQSFIMDLSAFKQSNLNLNIDFCEQTSKLKPFIYPFLLIFLTVSLVFFTIKIIGGL